MGLSDAKCYCGEGVGVLESWADEIGECGCWGEGLGREWAAGVH